MRKLRWHHLGVATLGLWIVGAKLADASIFYSNDFQNGTSLNEWRNERFTNGNGTAFTRFLGRYQNERTELTVPTPARSGDPGSTRLQLDFLFYAIDSWDGSDTTNGPDTFAVTINNVTVFNETFANQHIYQSYTGTPIAGPTQLGFDGRWNDSIYAISIPFDTSAPTIEIDFFAYGLLGVLTDESWGIDNVQLSVVPIPGPATGLGLGAMLAWVGAQRRRAAQQPNMR